MSETEEPPKKKQKQTHTSRVSANGLVGHILQGMGPTVPLVIAELVARYAESRFASADSEGYVSIWGAESGECIARSRHEFPEPIRGLAFHADGLCISATAPGNAISIMDGFTAICSTRKTRVNSWEDDHLAISGDGKVFAWGGESEIVRIIKLKNCSTTHSAPGNVFDIPPLRGHRDDIQAVALSSDGSRCVSAGDDARMLFWDTKTGKYTHVVPQTMFFSSLAVSPDDSCVAGLMFDHEIGGDQTIGVWSLSTSTCLALFSLEAFAGVMAWGPDSKSIAFSDFKADKIRIWTIDSEFKVSEKISIHTNQFATTLAFMPNGGMIIGGHSNGSISVWNSQTGERLHRLDGATQITALACAPF
jgi:WD40 repeat protein